MLAPGGIIGIAIAVAAAALIAVILLVMLIQRRSRSYDDRNMYLFESHPEGASIAYVPEHAIPKLPDSLKHFDSETSHSIDTASEQTQRLWQKSRIYEPEPLQATIDEHEFEAEVDDADISHNMFSNEPVMEWRARSVAQQEITNFQVSGAWNEEEAKAEAQQRRKEQREAAWARKKRERMAMEMRNGESVDANGLSTFTNISDLIISSFLFLLESLGT